MPRAPGGQQQPVAGLVGAQRLLRVHDLDRDDEREQRDGDALAGDQQARRPVSARVAQARAQAVAQRLALGVRGGQPARGGEDRGDESERGRVDEQRGRDPETFDQQPAERRAADARAREGDVEQRVALAQQPARVEHGVGRGARQRALGDPQDAVGGREQQDQRQRERVRQQGEQHERDRLAGVERRQHAAQRELVDARGERRAGQGGQRTARRRTAPRWRAGRASRGRRARRARPARRSRRPS